MKVVMIVRVSERSMLLMLSHVLQLLLLVPLILFAVTIPVVESKDSSHYQLSDSITQQNRRHRILKSNKSDHVQNEYPEDSFRQQQGGTTDKDKDDDEDTTKRFFGGHKQQHYEQPEELNSYNKQQYSVQELNLMTKQNNHHPH